MIDEKLLKPYDPASTEKRIYEMWENSGFFNPDNLPERHLKPFTIVMPPPNANGSLHAGHALTLTIQDTMIRYKRMQGFKTLWLPGSDHAGFETQVVYEKKLEKEGRSRFKMQPDELYKEILSFTLENKKGMENQVRSIGSSCDWSREKFTLDESVIKEVHNTFKKMYDDGLAYRGNRMANWCTKHQTSLSDIETESREKLDKLYYIKYGPLTVATVRPETIFGDVAVAVNPEDERYKHLINTDIEVEIPTGKLTLKIIGDENVDKEFGTGALKITPSHDKNDFEMATRHNLTHIEVIDKLGRLNEKTGKYAGLKILEARKQVVEDLQAMNLIEKIEDYNHEVPVCYKCETTIEPREMPQWFVKMRPLADLALKAVQEKKVEFIPENYEKIFTYWMDNTLDWNISRQIVWGIPIPAKLCTECTHGEPDLEDKLTNCSKCNAPLAKDSDTFDTWFSSGQWPLMMLNFPDGKDFKEFYPTDVMETGRDLIFKWIPRMVIFGLYLAKDVPFKYVYLNGLVNDSHGKKMSKSKGNVVNPIELTDKYGTDALRMGLIVGNAPGTDLALQENKIKGYRNFSNKLWNISRFILESTKDIAYDSNFSDWSETDLELRKTRDEEIKEASKEIEAYKIHIAAERLYQYTWSSLADKIIEESKPILKSENVNEKISRAHFLLETLSIIIKTLHPFMPFVTEELWSMMPFSNKSMLMIEKWPIENN